MNSQPRLTTLDYLVEVANGWAMGRFAAAKTATSRSRRTAST